jgi:type VI secretion system secreted protein VgrG
VELISECADLGLASLLHQRAFLAFSPNGDGIHGIAHRAEQGESGKRMTRYRLAIVPLIVAPGGGRTRHRPGRPQLAWAPPRQAILQYGEPKQGLWHFANAQVILVDRLCVTHADSMSHPTPQNFVCRWAPE